MSMSLLLGWGAYAQDKDTSARLCAKNAEGAYARGGAYLRDTMVISFLVFEFYGIRFFPERAGVFE